MIDETKKKEVIEKLEKLAKQAEDGLEEVSHIKADNLLLDLINDDDISNTFLNIRKYYS